MKNLVTTINQLLLTWGPATLFFGLLLWLLYPALLPFIFAFLIAYFLDPGVKLLQKMGISRALSAGSIIILFITGIIILSWTVIPALYQQINDFIAALPVWFNQLHTQWVPYLVHFFEISSPPEALSATTAQPWLQKIPDTVGDLITALVTHISGNVIHSGRMALGIASFIVILPLLIFYVLRDWPSIIKNIDRIIPCSYKNSIHVLARRIDIVLSGYVRGQINVALVSTIMATISYFLLGVEHSLLIGVMYGICSLIPYLGAFFSFAIIVPLVLSKHGLFSWYTGYAVLIFCLLQVFENNYLRPKLVSDQIGIHPLWILFGVLTGGTLLGLPGVLLAIPATAIISVLVQYLVEYYKESTVYTS